MTVPARLLIRTGWPSRTRLTIWPISTSTVSGSSPSAGRGGLEPGDVAVVVGAEHVDAEIEAALPLVEVVGDVAGDVGGLTVALDDDAVLVVAEVGGAQPGCAVLLVDVAGLAQLGDGLLDPAGGVHRVFVGVDVEVGAELVQRLLDVAEHQVDADRAERLLLLLVGQASARRALRLSTCGGDVVDVARRRSRPRAWARPWRRRSASGRTGRSGRRGR